MEYIPSKSLLLKLWNRWGKSAFGRWLIGKMVCFKAPYFGTIKPCFIMVKPGLVELSFKKRRAVLNHIGSVHAIAMCNAAELAAGTCVDVSLTANMRWIPIGMTVQYVKKAMTNLTAKCQIDDFLWHEKQDIHVPVSIVDTEGDIVFQADILMRISPKA